MDYQDVIVYLNQNDYAMQKYDRKNWDNFIHDSGLKLEIPYIHITGSNGKGSTANYLYEIYKAAGYNVGIFTSPYFEYPNNSIKVGEYCIKDSTFARIFEKYETLIKKHSLTSFEVLTLIAFEFFNNKNPDIVILETGMGGLIDSTNVLSSIPLVSIITEISLEHTKFLGDKLKHIAQHKAGIIKPNSQCIIDHQSKDVYKIINKEVKRKKAKLIEVKDPIDTKYSSPYYYFSYGSYEKLSILSPAKYLLKNAALAIEAIGALQSSFPVNEYSLRKGLLTPPLPCRFEKIENVILDGAHNPRAIESLAQSIKEYANGKRIHILFASYKDKDIFTELATLKKISNDITITTFDSRRARKEKDYGILLERYNFNDDFKLSISNYIGQFPKDIILVTGGLEFTYQIRKYLLIILRHGK